jgi:hypothetical protein
MYRGATFSAIFYFLATLAACSPEQRNYGSGGGGGQGGAGQGGGGGQGGGDLAAKACDSYAFDVCTHLQSCAPGNLTTVFGDFDTCHTRYTTFCSLVLAAPSTGWTPAQMKACGESMGGSFDCTTFMGQPFRSVDTLTPEACVPPVGGIDDGKPCVDDGQCKSAHCRKLGLCGVCGPRSAAGEACAVNRDCQANLVCLAGKCVKAAELGEACTDGQVPCNAPYVCFNGTCATFQGQGSQCSANYPPCDPLQAVSCSPAAGICTLPKFANTGDPCTGAAGGAPVCQGSGFCDMGTGTCVAVAADGKACDPQKGPNCMLPALCISGTCTLPDGALCK